MSDDERKAEIRAKRMRNLVPFARGNPGTHAMMRGKFRDTKTVRISRKYSPSAIEACAEIFSDPKQPARDRIKAAEVVLAYGQGKPMQSVHVSGSMAHVDATKAFAEAMATIDVAQDDENSATICRDEDEALIDVQYQDVTGDS